MPCFCLLTHTLYGLLCIAVRFIIGICTMSDLFGAPCFTDRCRFSFAVRVVRCIFAAFRVSVQSVSVRHGRTSNHAVVLSCHARAIFAHVSGWHLFLAFVFLQVGVAGLPWHAFCLCRSSVGIQNGRWWGHLSSCSVIPIGTGCLWDSAQSYRRQLTIFYNNN